MGSLSRTVLGSTLSVTSCYFGPSTVDRGWQHCFRIKAVTQLVIVFLLTLVTTILSLIISDSLPCQLYVSMKSSISSDYGQQISVINEHQTQHANHPSEITGALLLCVSHYVHNSVLGCMPCMNDLLIGFKNTKLLLFPTVLGRGAYVARPRMFHFSHLIFNHFVFYILCVNNML